MDIKKRLEEIRESIRNENISYGEIAELQTYKNEINKDDVELGQWLDTASLTVELTREEIIDSLIENIMGCDADDVENIGLVENMLKNGFSGYVNYDNEDLITEYREVFEEYRNIIII